MFNGCPLSYGVSYVTSFGEGRIKWTGNPTSIEHGRRFVKVSIAKYLYALHHLNRSMIQLKLKPVQGVRDISLDFLPKDKPHPAAGVAIVRRGELFRPSF